jgi:hypothetical protein
MRRRRRRLAMLIAETDGKWGRLKEFGKVVWSNVNVKLIGSLCDLSG